MDHSDVPIRLFKSDFLEFFTHISPLAVIIIWVPVVGYFLVASVLAVPAGGFPFFIPICFLAGLFLWTLAEYTLHRFVFHFEPKSEQAKRIVFLFHGIHHAQPQIKTRLVMPPVVSIPLALAFYGLFNLVLGLHLAFAFVITVGGLLQLIPAIRRTRPALHRWTGRAYLVAAARPAIFRNTPRSRPTH